MKRRRGGGEGVEGGGDDGEGRSVVEGDAVYVEGSEGGVEDEVRRTATQEMDRAVQTRLRVGGSVW